MVVELDVHENYFFESFSGTIVNNDGVSEKINQLEQITTLYLDRLAYISPFIFTILQPRKTFKISTEKRDCGNVLTNDEQTSVLCAVR